MEPLNTKLYEKYKNLKKRKFFEEEEWNRKRDTDLRSYQSAMEDLIEEMKNANERLRAELYSFQEQYANCEKSLLEESQKSKELSDEVGRLQNLLLRKNDTSDKSLMSSPCSIAGVMSTEIPKSLPRQKTPDLCEEISPIQNKEAATLTYDSHKVETKVPDCCRRNMGSSSDASEDCCNCVFQTLMKLLVGMDFSVNSQTESLCLLVVHKMSGYSFSLTWMPRDGGEGELMYRVSSLGTLERVALDWMKEDMIFSTAMCRVFFERVTRVTGRS
ncbi:uncharacterized protein LOC135645142 [Musa acuminata AAA Group]|uniref:uncharacterized protein LOC135645142 n=1 Tax=Musa acuminata AAA Group TaxID=214697 RepID=UPI0031D0EBCE